MTSCRKFLEQLKIRHICSNKYIQRRQTLINAVRPLARDESAVFLLYLPPARESRRLFFACFRAKNALFLDGITFFRRNGDQICVCDRFLITLRSF